MGCPAPLPAQQSCCLRESFLRHTAALSLYLVLCFSASATDLEKGFCVSERSAFPSSATSVGDNSSTNYSWCKHLLLLLLLSCEELGNKSMGQLRAGNIRAVCLPGSTALAGLHQFFDIYLHLQACIDPCLHPAALESYFLHLYCQNARSLDEPAKPDSDTLFTKKPKLLYGLEGEDYPHKLTSAFSRTDL